MGIEQAAGKTVPLDVVQAYITARIAYEDALRPAGPTSTPRLAHNHPALLGYREARYLLNKAVLKANRETPCGCRPGECENKPGKRCRMADEVAKGGL